MNLKHVIKEYFSYSASEKKGLLVLVVLLLVMYLLPFIFSSKKHTGDLFDIQKQKQIDSLLAIIDSRKKAKKLVSPLKLVSYFDPNTASKNKLCSIGFTTYQAANLVKYRERGGRFREKKDLLKIYGISQTDFERIDTCIRISFKPKKNKEGFKKKEYHLFLFDPNTISSEEWKRLGVDTEICNRIQNYLSTGARFKEASDLQKIYGFDSNHLKKLIPYVKIQNLPFSKASVERITVDLNSSDTIQLKLLPGIGSVLSARIVKYRNLLGGFVSKDQLLEVYGISKEKYKSIASQITVDSISLRRIKLNSFDSENLRKHPYINFRMSKDIIRFRDRNGNFTSLDQLIRHQIISDSLFNKLSPYLELK